MRTGTRLLRREPASGLECEPESARKPTPDASTAVGRPGSSPSGANPCPVTPSFGKPSPSSGRPFTPRQPLAPSLHANPASNRPGWTKNCAVKATLVLKKSGFRSKRRAFPADKANLTLSVQDSLDTILPSARACGTCRIGLMLNREPFRSQPERATESEGSCASFRDS